MNKNEYISWQFRRQVEDLLSEIDRIADDVDEDPVREGCPANNVMKMIVKLHGDFTKYIISDKKNSKHLRLYDKFQQEIKIKPYPHPMLDKLIRMN